MTFVWKFIQGFPATDTHKVKSLNRLTADKSTEHWNSS